MEIHENCKAWALYVCMYVCMYVCLGLGVAVCGCIWSDARVCVWTNMLADGGFQFVCTYKIKSIHQIHTIFF